MEHRRRTWKQMDSMLRLIVHLRTLMQTDCLQLVFVAVLPLESKVGFRKNFQIQGWKAAADFAFEFHFRPFVKIMY